MSILDPFTCGFAKIAAFHAFNHKHGIKKRPSETDNLYKGRILRFQYGEFLNCFPNLEGFFVEYDIFKRRFSPILKHIRTIGKRHKDVKDALFDAFSLQIFKRCSEKKKRMHSLHDCKGCLGDKELKAHLSKFPINSRKLQGKAQNGGLFKEKVLEDITNTVVKSLDQKFQETYNTSFTKQLERKRRKEEHEEKKQKADIVLARQIKSDIETQWKGTSVER